MITNTIKYLAVFGVFFFPFVLFKSLAFPLGFSHIVFMFTLIEFLVFLFLFNGLQSGELVVKKSYLIPALIFYIAVLFLTALTGSEFSYSFWSSYSRATGIITWLHYFSFFLVLSSLFTKVEDWRNIFRALTLSGFILASLSFLGVGGLGWSVLDFLDLGGSFLGNTSYSGAYLLLIFFFSVIGFLLESERSWKMVYSVSLLTIFFNPDLFNFNIWKGALPLSEVLQNPALFAGVARASSLVLWGGVILSGILFILSKIKNKRVVIGLGVSILVIFFGLYTFIFSSIIKQEGKIYDLYLAVDSRPVRPMVWNMAVEGIKERPLLGYGDGNFKYVYQKYLNPKMIQLENPSWFDRVHNFTLEELVGHGVLGALAIFLIFIFIVFTSFKLYLEKEKFYFLFIPFIFIFHFLQLQTFFQIDSTLFLSFLLLAFLVSHQDSFVFKIPWRNYWVQVVLLILLIFSFVFFVSIPIKENRLILLIKNTQNRDARLEFVKELDNLNIDPVETLRQVSNKFMNETANRAQEIQKAGFVQNVAEEYKIYLDTYDYYLPKYSGYHRYLFEYANLINTAFIFGINDLAKGEELARQAIEISNNYPHPYWVLAINLYYQNKADDALYYAKYALDLEPTIKKSKEVYENIQMRKNLKSQQQSFFYLSGI